MKAVCLRIKIVAERARPTAILFEDDLHFNGQRDKTNDGWTGPCCYCPLHLAEFALRCGRVFTREELVAATEGDDPQARELRRIFAEMLSDNMLSFGQSIREAVDEVSPETEMGMSGSGDIFRNNGTAIYRYASPSGTRIGVVATTIPWNRSASIFSTRKREVLSGLLEWTACGEITVRVADEPNVMLLASTDEDRRTLVTTIINLRPDIIDGLDLLFATHWMDASVEELASDGAWRQISTKQTSTRTRRLEGIFAPGIARVFKFSK